MEMPETPVHKDNLPSPGEDQVRPAGQDRSVQSVPIAHVMY